VPQQSLSAAFVVIVDTAESEVSLAARRYLVFCERLSLLRESLLRHDNEHAFDPIDFNDGVRIEDVATFLVR